MAGPDSQTLRERLAVIRGLRGPLAAGSVSVLTLLVVVSLFTGSVTRYRMLELDHALTTAARFRKERRNLAMLIQYELLKHRAHNPAEAEEDYRVEAELVRMVEEDAAQERLTAARGSPLAAAAIRAVRFVMGKPPLESAFEQPLSTHLRVAHLLERQRRYRRAIAHYGRALESEPELAAEILLHQAFCYSLIGEFDDALLLFDRVQREYPGRTEAVTAARLFQELETIRDAAGRLPTAHAADDAGIERARALFGVLRYDDALSELGRLLADKPAGEHMPEALFLTGRCYEHIARDSLAILTYERLVDISVPNAWTKRAHQRLLMLGAVYRARPEVAGEAARELSTTYYQDDFVADIEHLAPSSTPAAEDLQKATAAIMSLAEREYPYVAALVKEENREDSIVGVTERLLQATIKAEENDAERRQREDRWRDEAEAFLEQQRRLREERERTQQYRQSLRDSLAQAFSTADSQWAAASREQIQQNTVLPDSTRQEEPSLLSRLFTHGRELAEKRSKERQQRLDEARARKESRARLSRLKERIDTQRRNQTRVEQLQEHNDELLGRAEQDSAREAEGACLVLISRAPYREFPDQSSKTLGWLYRADAVTRVGTRGDYLYVQIEDVGKVWMSTRHVASESELGPAGIARLQKQAEEEKRQWVVTVDSAHMAPSPGTEDRIARVCAGDTVTMLTRSRGSVKVSSGGASGWVPASSVAWVYRLPAARLRALAARGRQIRQDLARIEKERTAQAAELEQQTAQLRQVLLRKHRSRRVVERKLARYGGDFMRAYNRRLRQRPELKGLVKVGFVIRPDGVTDSVRVVSSTVQDAWLAEQVVAVVRKVQFDAVAENVGTTRHEYAIPFVPAGTPE